MGGKEISKFMAMSLIFLAGGVLGYLFCFHSNGYERSIYAFDATNTEDGKNVIKKLLQIKSANIDQTIPFSEILTYTPQKICVQPPYMTAGALRQNLKVNLIGFRMASETENLLWVIEPSLVAKYISINRVTIADIDRDIDGNLCIDGRLAVLQASNTMQKLRLISKEKL